MTTLYDPFTLELYLQLAPIKVQTEKALFSFEITFDVDPIKQVQQLSELPVKFYRARVNIIQIVNLFFQILMN